VWVMDGAVEGVSGGLFLFSGCLGCQNQYFPTTELGLRQPLPTVV